MKIEHKHGPDFDRFIAAWRTMGDTHTVTQDSEGAIIFARSDWPTANNSLHVGPDRGMGGLYVATPSLRGIVYVTDLGLRSLLRGLSPKMPFVRLETDADSEEAPPSHDSPECLMLSVRPEGEAAAQPSTMAEAIVLACAEFQELLLAKNAAYGDAAYKPIRVFSKLPALEGVKLRTDDKLSRLIRGIDAGEDSRKDLAGYLILWRAIELLEAAQGGDPPAGA